MPAGPLRGTRSNPQGRLFTPTGQYQGDTWKLEPSRWLGLSDIPAHQDITAWHSSHSETLPRWDDPESRRAIADDYFGEDDDYDFSVDSQERPMAEYGSAVGMHFGTLKSALDRGG